ncbi:MAG: inositol monophosphatase [Myxococcales bacterium]|nr:inositol monophosphatase [Myxococcales bacterium]
MTGEDDTVLELAVRLARAAGAIQRERYETNFEVRTKSAAIDLVTEVDHACEALIVETLNEERPDDAIVAEEGGGEDWENASWRWVIDPLDGTTNYAHGYPRFCVSIGVERDGDGAVGVVFDPMLDELYTAVRGRGAALNGRRLRVSEETELNRALVATGFAYDVQRSREDNLNHFASFIKTVRAVRRDGSAALDLCYVAAGRLDGFWELKLHPWDVAAGNLIVAEAGGRVSDLSGGPALRSGQQTVASNGHLHASILNLLARP